MFTGHPDRCFALAFVTTPATLSKITCELQVICRQNFEQEKRPPEGGLSGSTSVASQRPVFCARFYANEERVRPDSLP
jgi:hypothetical protein